MTTSSHQGLSCPVCRVALVMSDRQGVEIDFCPQCRGVWLDRGELDKIIERGASEIARQSSPRASYGYDRESYRTGHGHGDHRPRRRKSFLEELFD